MASTRQKILDLLHEIDAAIERHEGQIRVLRDKAGELQTALRVIDQVESKDDGDEAFFDLQLSPPSATDVEAAEIASGRKPAGLPAITEMIVETLRQAKKAGLGPLSPSTITHYIRDRWWPGADGKSVAPTAWRMAQHGRIVRLHGGLYSLPDDQRESDEAEGQSPLKFEDLL